MAELRLSHRIAIEAGALYRGVNRRSSGAYVLTWGQRESGSAWDFPVVGKFRFAFAPAGFRPFVTAGPVFFILRSTVESSGTTLVEGPDGRPVSVPYSTTDSKRDSGTGFTAGGGIEKLAGRARISFEGRLTIWPGQPVNQGGVGCGIVCHQSPQFGIGF